MADLLRMDHINSLGQLYAETWHGNWWPVTSIEVGTGLMKIDVCGMIDNTHIEDIQQFRDDDGTIYQPEDFYTETEGETP